METPPNDHGANNIGFLRNRQYWKNGKLGLKAEKVFLVGRS